MERQINSTTGVCHFRAALDGSLRALLMNADYSPLDLAVTETQLDRWLEFGCVYVEGVRQRTDRPLGPGALVRLHTHPKRFACPDAETLRARIAFADDSLLVLDKPSGLPTHPTLDNFIENAKTALERALGITLYTTHRLDVPTQGLLIFAKTPDAQRQINKLLSKGRVHKEYRAVCDRPVWPGLYSHYLDPESRVPKQVYDIDHVPGEKWQECRLRVESTSPIEDGFSHEMQLMTGRTHQIRAQLAHMGAPIRGDVDYGGAALDAPGILLECYRLSFQFQSRPYLLERKRGLLG